MLFLKAGQRRNDLHYARLLFELASTKKKSFHTKKEGKVINFRGKTVCYSSFHLMTKAYLNIIGKVGLSYCGKPFSETVSVTG